jgi:hypothetical protein
VIGAVTVYGSVARDGGPDDRSISPSLTVRPSTQLELSLRPSLSWNNDPTQYVESPVVSDSARYILGSLEQRTRSMVVRLSYTLTPALSIQLYAQPFSSSGSYDSFSLVRQPRAARLRDRLRELSTVSADQMIDVDENADGHTDYSFGNPAFEARDLRSNAVLRWEYRAGSTLFLAWTQQRSGGEQRGTNVLLVKLSHWLGL